MWELAQVRVSERDRIESYLKGGYEPFAITVDPSGWETVWFKKAIDAPTHMDKVKERVEELNLEVHSKPEHKQGKGRRATKTAKK